MLLNAIILFLCVVGVGIYVSNKKWVVAYCVLIQILSLPIFSLVARCPFEYSLGDVATAVSKFSSFYLFAIAVLLLIHVKLNYQIKRLFFVFALFALYTLVSKMIFTGTFATVPTTIFDVAVPVFVFVAIYSNPQTVVENRKIDKITKKIIILEILISLINICGIYLFIPHYFPTVVEGEWGNLITLNESKVCGTFDRYNTLASFLATLYMFVLHLYYIRKQIPKKTFRLITVAFLVIIGVTGAKISLVSMLFFLAVYCFKYSAKSRIPLVVIALNFSFILALLANYTPGTFKNEGIDRQLTGLSNAISGEKGDDNSTLSLSTYLLDNYFHKSPFFGNNNLWKGDNAYGNFTNHKLDLFNADAKLALILVDSGLFGLFLTLFCFYGIFKAMQRKLPHKDRWGILMLFCYFCAQTITDGGFYDVSLMILAYIFFTYIRREICFSGMEHT